MRTYKPDREILHQRVLIEEIVCDHLAFVTECEDESIEVVMGIYLHDMPEDRVLAELNKRFRHFPGFFRETGTSTAAKNKHVNAFPWRIHYSFSWAYRYKNMGLDLIDDNMLRPKI